jgi:hypothetical protein
LAGNLLSPVANVVTVYALLRSWCGLGVGQWPGGGLRLYTVTLATSALATVIRAWCVTRLFGWKMGLTVPLRAVVGNFVNCAATVCALRQFAAAWLAGEPLAWRKTDHSYPSVVTEGRQRLGELLVRMRCLSLEELERTLDRLPRGIRIGEHLMRERKLTEEELYRALSLQCGVPLGAPGRDEVQPAAFRELPLSAMRRWRVVPYRVTAGQLHLITTEAPSEVMAEQLALYSALEMRFRLVRPWEFEQFARAYLESTARL